MTARLTRAIDRSPRAHQQPARLAWFGSYAYAGHHVLPADQDARAVVTPMRPKVISTRSSARQAFTYTSSCSIIRKVVTVQYIFLSHKCIFGQCAILIWEGSSLG